MTEQEKQELLKSHAPEDEGAKKRYEENPPHIVEKLNWNEGEGVISELSTKDLIQLGSRYLNDFGVLLRNLLHYQLRIEKILTFIAEDRGIDVNKAFKEDAKKVEQLINARVEASKEALKNIKKSN